MDRVQLPLKGEKDPDGRAELFKCPLALQGLEDLVRVG